MHVQYIYTPVSSQLTSQSKYIFTSIAWKPDFFHMVCFYGPLIVTNCSSFAKIIQIAALLSWLIIDLTFSSKSCKFRVPMACGILHTFLHFELTNCVTTFHHYESTCVSLVYWVQWNPCCIDHIYMASRHYE